MGELQLDVRRPCSEAADSDSRPSSGSLRPGDRTRAGPAWRGRPGSRAQLSEGGPGLENPFPRSTGNAPLPSFSLNVLREKGYVHVGCVRGETS